MSRMIVSVPTMKCAGCVASVDEALCSLPGASDVSVSLEDKTAEVTLQEALPIEVVVDVISQAGHRASPV